MIVVDTNILSYFYLPSDFSVQVEALHRLDSQWIAPLIWRSEFRNVLAFYLRKNLLALNEAQDMMSAAERIFKEKEYQIPSYQVLELVDKSSCSAYDCEFVALAKEKNIPLITADKKILSEFPNIAFSIEAFLS